MKTQYYFKHKDSEICYTKEYFNDYMRENNIKQYDVYKGISERIGGGIFWCKEHSFCGGDTNDTCGKKNCKNYSPRNKISGVCKHHTSWLYTHGDIITLKLLH